MVHAMSAAREHRSPRVGPLRRFFGRAFLWVFGWKAIGEVPDVPRAVFVANPHTTNWDLPFTICVAWALGLRISWAGKASLFRFPFGWLMRALGASAFQVAGLFLAESAAVALLGGAAGVALGLSLGGLLRLAIPGLPISTPLSFVLAALGVSFAVGILSGVLPARRAAELDPIEALRAE